MLIRDPDPEDETAWRALWHGYVDFYEASVPEEVTKATWARLLAARSGMFARLAESGGRVAGFAMCVLHPGSWTTAPICYLEDLYVDQQMRGLGIGRALIDDLINKGRERGWSRLYWHTRNGNAAARQLYDKFCPADDFVRYRLFLG